MSCGSAISPTYPIDLSAPPPALRIRAQLARLPIRWLLDIAARLHARQHQRRALRERGKPLWR